MEFFFRTVCFGREKILNKNKNNKNIDNNNNNNNNNNYNNINNNNSNNNNITNNNDGIVDIWKIDLSTPREAFESQNNIGRIKAGFPLLLRSSDQLFFLFVWRRIFQE